MLWQNFTDSCTWRQLTCLSDSFVLILLSLPWCLFLWCLCLANSFLWCLLCLLLVFVFVDIGYILQNKGKQIEEGWRLMISCRSREKWSTTIWGASPDQKVIIWTNRRHDLPSILPRFPSTFISHHNLPNCPSLWNTEWTSSIRRPATLSFTPLPTPSTNTHSTAGWKSLEGRWTALSITISGSRSSRWHLTTTTTSWRPATQQCRIWSPGWSPTMYYHVLTPHVLHARPPLHPTQITSITKISESKSLKEEISLEFKSW